jgi:hypothetical protein
VVTAKSAALVCGCIANTGAKQDARDEILRMNGTFHYLPRHSRIFMGGRCLACAQDPATAENSWGERHGMTAPNIR